MRAASNNWRRWEVGKRKKQLFTYDEAMAELGVSRGTFYRRLGLAKARGENVEPVLGTHPVSGVRCQALTAKQVDLLRVGK